MFEDSSQLCLSSASRSTSCLIRVTLFRCTKSNTKHSKESRMCSPSDHDFTYTGLSRTLYLTYISKSTGALLALEVKRIEYPVYYLTRSPQGVKMKIPHSSVFYTNIC